MVSYYNWVRTGRQGRSENLNIMWDDWLNVVTDISDGRMSQCQKYLLYPYLFDNHEKLIVRHVFYFEDIPGSLNELSRILNLDLGTFDSQKFHLKKNRKRKDYREYYTNKQAELVENHFQKYLKYFPYQFDGVNKITS